MVFVIDAQVAGISGDMLLCSLVNIGANKSKIIDGIRSAESLCKDVKVKKIDFVEVKKNSLQATELLLEIDDDVHERKGIEIKEIIAKSAGQLKISESAKTFAVKSIETLIHAESKIHGEPEDSVHFHEAASFDTVVDILGTAIALDDLDCFDDDIIVTPVAIGGGTVTFSHGISSNPTYAVLEIFRESGIITAGGNVKDELTTPTGASILVNLAKECSEFYPPMKIQSVGYGAGQKDFEEFFTDNEDLDMDRFDTVGVIRNQPDFDEAKLDEFMDGIAALRAQATWTKDDIVKLYFGLLPEFAHKETGRYLDQRM